jgi:hypothetical protein
MTTRVLRRLFRGSELWASYSRSAFAIRHRAFRPDGNWRETRDESGAATEDAQSALS